MVNVNSELASYLKSKNGFNRLMENLKNKYISLSKFSGTITMDNLSLEESEDISNLLGRKVLLFTA